MSLHNRDTLEGQVKIRTQQLQNLNKKLQASNNALEDAKHAMLNVMEDLENAKDLIEVARVKDEAMLASIGEGLIAVDNEGKVMVMNRAAEEMLDLKFENIFGKKIVDLPLEDSEGAPIPKDKRPTSIALTTGKVVKNIYYFKRKNKLRFPIAITITPIKLGEKTLGLIEMIRDVTRELEIDKAKSEFVSLASHQLRTPLGIMKWYIEALVDEGYYKNAPKFIKKYIDEIYKSNERVLSLVRNLLSVSRIDQGKVKNNPKSVDVNLVIQDIVEQMKIVARKKDVGLKLNIENKDIPHITIDALRFHEVVENLIVNAVEYTTKKGLVRVTVKKINDIISITVNDTGIGISQEDRKKLFTKFFRSENAIVHNPEGSGLGLYVVKSYVDGWGGEITVESSEGKGSMFTVNLPIYQRKMKEGD